MEDDNCPFIRGTKQFRIHVVGDGNQQKAIAGLVGPRRHERLNIHVRAQLALQDDETQVLVSIQGHQVGHLSRAAAQALHRIVRYGERSPHETFECNGRITGLAGQLTIRLDLPLGDD